MLPIFAEQYGINEFRLSLYIASAVLGAFVLQFLPVFLPAGLAEALDRVKQSDSVATMGALLSIYAIGNILGPLVSSITMKHFGNDVLFYFLAIAEFSLLLFLTYRIQVRAPVPLEDQESFVMHPSALGAPLVNLDQRIQSETSVPDFDDEQPKKKQLKSEQTEGQL